MSNGGDFPSSGFFDFRRLSSAADFGGLWDTRARREAPQSPAFDFLIKPSDMYDVCDIIRRLKPSDHISVTFRYVRYIQKFKFRNGNDGYRKSEFLEARGTKREFSSRRYPQICGLSPNSTERPNGDVLKLAVCLPSTVPLGGMTPRRVAPQAAQFDFLIKPSDMYDACDIIRRLKLSDHISVTFRYVRYTSKFKFRNGNIGFVTLEYLDTRGIRRKLSSRRCS